MASSDTTYGKPELVYVDYVQRYLDEAPELTRNSPIYQSLAVSIIKKLDDQQKFLIWLSENLLNIDEAKGYHLDLIGQFVGQSRVLASFETGVYFGFEGAYQSGTFGDINDPNTGAEWYDNNSYREDTSKVLNDEQYRRVIKARICKNGVVFNSIDELLEVINYLTGNTQTTLSVPQHGLIEAKVQDTEGLLSYFLSRQYNNDNILPIPLGVRFNLVE